jgi:hypothetical protein
VRIQARNHGDSGLDLLLWHRGAGARQRPLHSQEVGHAKPSLVKVDHVLVLQLYLQEGARKVLPEQLILDGVSLPGDALDALVLGA